MGDVIRFPVERCSAAANPAAIPELLPPPTDAISPGLKQWLEPIGPSCEAVLLVASGAAASFQATYLGQPVPVILAGGNGAAVRLRP